MKGILAALACGLLASLISLQAQAQNQNANQAKPNLAIPPQLVGKTLKIGFIETREQRVLDETINFTTWKARIELTTLFKDEKTLISSYIAFVPTEDGKPQPQRNVQRNSEGGRKTMINGRQIQIIDAQNGGARSFLVQIDPSFSTCQVELKYVKQAEHWLSSGIRDKKTFEMRNHQASNLSCALM